MKRRVKKKQYKVGWLFAKAAIKIATEIASMAIKDKAIKVAVSGVLAAATAMLPSGLPSLDAEPKRKRSTSVQTTTEQ